MPSRDGLIPNCSARPKRSTAWAYVSEAPALTASVREIVVLRLERRQLLLELSGAPAVLLDDLRRRLREEALVAESLGEPLVLGARAVGGDVDEAFQRDVELCVPGHGDRGVRRLDGPGVDRELPHPRKFVQVVALRLDEKRSRAARAHDE